MVGAVETAESASSQTLLPKIKDFKRIDDVTYEALVAYTSLEDTISIEISRDRLLAYLRAFRKDLNHKNHDNARLISQEDLNTFLAREILKESGFTPFLSNSLPRLLDLALKAESIRQERDYFQVNIKGNSQVKCGDSVFQSAQPPIAVVIAMRSYPYGGGEAYLIDSSKWLQRLGYRVIIVNTRRSDWSLIESGSVTPVNGITRISVPGIDTDAKIAEMIDAIVSLLNPDFIHCQGEVNLPIMSFIKPWWPTIVCGFHFWTGLINLHEDSNIDILASIEKHTVNPLFLKSIGLPNFKPYIVSKFMQSVLNRLGVDVDIPILPPVEFMNKNRNLNVVDSRRLSDSEYVLQLNCSTLKGGQLFLRMAERLSEVKFLGYCSTQAEFRSLSSWAAKEILAAHEEEGSLRINHNCLVHSQYIDDPAQLYQKASVVLVPSLVDETFSRVVVEALLAEVPVLATSNGNLSNIIPPKYTFDASDYDQWMASIQLLVNSEHERAKAVEEQRNYLFSSLSCGMLAFQKFISSSILPRTFRKNVVIVCPWSEQGLGYHAKLYAKALSLVGVTPHILSFQSYAAVDRDYAIQTAPDEWHGYNVHYSLNTREELSPHEIVQFCRLNNAKLILFPEICWEANWSKLYAVASSQIDVALIPNPETLRESEIANHCEFPFVLATTRLCERLLKDHGVNKVKYVGHAVDQLPTQDLRKSKAMALEAATKIKILHIAGYNHRRKMTHEIIEAMTRAGSTLPEIELKVVSQVPFSSPIHEMARKLPNATLISKNFSRNEIMSLIDESAYTLQLSTHEGLGLGFYESLSRGVPVITINAPPHNEHVIDGYNGHLIDGDQFPLYDNDESLIYGVRFSSLSLISLLRSLSLTLAKSMSVKCFDYVENHLAPLNLGRTLAESTGLLADNEKS